MNASDIRFRSWTPACSLFFLLIFVGSSALAVAPHSWPFEVPSEYGVSSSNDIQIAGGVASLQLSDLSFAHGELDDYKNGDVVGQPLYLGSGASIGLVKESGGLYAGNGSFLSRVISNEAGNVWGAMRVLTSSDTVANNNTLDTSSTLDGLAGLYHFNNDGVRDAVTGDSGTMQPGAGYSVAAVFGSHAFNGTGNNGYAILAGTNLLDDAPGVTIALWVKFNELRTSGYPYMANGLNYNAATRELRFGMKSKANAWTTVYCYGTTLVEAGEWFFIVGTFNSVDGRTRLYVNGQFEGVSINGFPGGNSSLEGELFVGHRNAWETSLQTIDEVLLFRRQLSDLEIEKLYRAGLGVKVQVRSGSSTNLLSDFVGPEGTNSAYNSGAHALEYGHGFDPSAPFLQYKVDVANAAARDSTPLVDSIVFLGTGAEAFDDTMGDFMEGTLSPEVVTYPAGKTGSYLGLSKMPNGAYRETGSFISQPLDAGAGQEGATWNRIFWVLGNRSLHESTFGLVGLWPLEGSWVEPTGANINYAETALDFTKSPKVGTGASYFNGENGSVRLVEAGGAGIGEFRSLEFWIDYDDPNGGLIEIQNAGEPSAEVCLTNGWVRTENWGGPVDVYVNGYNGSAQLESGWNHVALVTALPQSVSNMVVGQIQGDYFQGKLDDMAMFDRPLAAGEVAVHYLDAAREQGGGLYFEVRAADTLEALEGKSFSGPYSDGATDEDRDGGQDPLDGEPLSGQSGRYLQYKVNMFSDGNTTPSLQSVRATYKFINNIEENRAEDFAAGIFEDESTRWYGNEMAKENLGSIGPFNARPPKDTGWEGLWHMDEGEWTGVKPVKDSSGLETPRHGQPNGDAQTAEKGRVGTRCAYFDGVGDAVTLQPLYNTADSDFTLGLWFKTTSTSRAGLLSNFDGLSYWSLEINGDGSGATVPGAAAFIIKNESKTPLSCSITGLGLNDGYWHHIAGVRRDPYIQLYIDGARAASTWIGNAYGILGITTPRIAQYGTSEIYYAGYIDEVAVLSRPMSDAEIGALAGVGRGLGADAEFISEPIDADRVSIWRQISWDGGGPHGTPLEADDTTLAGLWHLDEPSGDAVDESAYGNNGAVSVAGRGSAGIFSNCFDFAGGDDVTVSGGMGLVTAVTAEAWVYTDDPRDRVVVERTDGSSGFVLGLDVDGRPTFRMGGAQAAVSPLPLQVDRWSHVAGTYDGKKARLYVDGALVAAQKVIGVGADSGTDLVIGSGFVGRIDEVAVHNRALIDEELRDHYRSGTGDIRFQVRVGDDPLPLDGDFIGPDGTTNSYFREFWGAQMGSDLLGVHKYLQYRVVMDNDNHRFPTVLRGVQADVTSFSTVNPWVEPADGFGYDFTGRLTSFDHALGLAGPNTGIRYQLSGDNGANWYYWGGSAWEVSTGLDWPGEVSEAGTISSNIPSFFDQLYSKEGGTFKFRAFLHSLGDYQIELDEVDIEASTGRIVVTEPNGDEVGDDAWVVGVANIITWDAEGSVGSSLTIEFSDDGGQSWSVVDDNVPHSGTNGSYAWPTPYFGLGAGRDECRIKITDNSDTTVWDTSDADFELVFRYRLISPNGGEVWYIGETNVIRWHEPPGLGTPADLYFNLNGHSQLGTSLDDPGWQYRESVPTTPGSTNNTYAWVTPKDIPELISPAARLQITPENSMAAHDMSDNSYTMAGIRITNPNDSTAWKRGSEQTVTWAAAGDVAGGVTLEFSGDGGANWDPVVPGTIPCSVHSNNTYSWTIVADNPSQNSMLRMISANQSRIWAVSDVFTVSDIDIKAPVAGDEWQTLSTELIKWTAGGAGDEVNLFYSIDGGTNWILINEDDPVFNDNTTGVTNEYPWVVPDLPGDTQIRIQSLLSAELFADSDVFQISGIRITAPNSDARWEYGTQNTIDWVYAGNGLEQGRVRFSYDGGNSFTNLKDVGLFSQNFAFTPDKPTTRALARVEALDEPYASLGVAGQSDGVFTNAGIKVTSPLQADVIKMGERSANPIEWLSAGVLPNNGVVDLSFSDGTTETALFTLQNNEDFNETTFVSGFNFKPWTPEMSLNPSETARIKVLGDGPFGDYTAWSEQFILQGVRIVEPTSGSSWNIDTTREIRWLNAGFGSGADARMYISTDGGSTFDPTPILPDVILNNGDVDWLIPFGTPPNTNAVLRLDVVDDPDSFSAYSLPFTLKGLSVSQPTVGTSWDLGSTETIEVLAAGAGNLVNVYYSSDDGASFDTDNPIGEGVGISDGPNSLPWTIELYRVPSTNARIWVDSISTDATIVSDPFTMAGILVTEPASVNIWAANETNHIEWIAVGTSGEFDVFLKDGGTETLIGDDIVGTSLEYPTLPGDAGTDLYIVVRDTSGAYEGVSEPFKIVQDPTLEVLEPVDGQFLKNGRTYQVVWTKAGAMELTFEASYSFDDFATSNVISGVPVLANNQYFLDWELDDPAELGLAKVRVVNTSIPSIQDTTEDINMVADITVNSPNGGSQYYALKTYDVAWFTSGNTTEFDIYYSTNQFRPVDSWKKINTAGPISGLGHGQLSQWSDWMVADDVSATVWLRIQDANFTDIYPANVDGPFDDSDAMFSIIYYTIQWNVINQETRVALDKLAVSDSSGWSESGLSSPVIHYYPYGYYDTIWSRALFASKVEFDWSPEPSRTIEVELLETGQEPDFDVMANFSYNSASRSFSIASWIERGGQVLGNPDASLIEIYESDGDKIKQISNPNSMNGVFFSTWNVNATEDEKYGTNFNYSASEVFWAKVLVQFSGEWYSSALTFQLRQPASDEILQVIDVIEAATSNILGEVSGIGSKIDNLSGQVGDGFSDVMSAVGTNTSLLLDDVLPGIEDVSNNLVNVFGPSVSNIEDVVQLISGEIGGARILTRPLQLVRGSTNTFLYRTQNYPDPVNQVFLSVRDTADNLIPGMEWGMSQYGSVSGVYRKDVPIPSNFAYDNCVLQCVDPDAADRLVVDVVDAATGDLPGLMADVVDKVTNMESNLASLADINTGLLDLTTVLEGMTNTITDLATKVDNLPDLGIVTQKIDELAVKLDNLPDLGTLTNIIGNLETKIDNLPDLSVVTQEIGELSLKLDNLPDLGTLSNIVGEIGLKIDSLPDLSGLSNSVGELQAAIAGIPTNIDFTAVQDGITDLRTDLAGVIGVDLSGAQASLDSILASLGGSGGTDLAGVPGTLDAIMKQVSGMGGMDMSGLEGQISALRGALQGVNEVNLSDLDSRLASLQSAIEGVGRIEEQLGAPADGAAGRAGTLFDQLDQIEVSTASAGASAAGAEKYASNAKTKAGDAASGISALKQALAAGDTEEAKRQLKLIRESLNAAKADIDRIPDGVTLDQLQTEMSATKKSVAELAASHGWTWLNSMGEDALTPGPADEEPVNLGTLSTRIEELRGSMEFMQKLIDKEVYKPEVEEQWIGVKE